MDSVQHLPNASSVAVPCTKPIRTGLGPEGARDATSRTAWQDSRWSSTSYVLGWNMIRR